jgi:hypothetical protein
LSIDLGFFRLRLLAAVLITVSGVGQVAMLWFRELTGAALIDALLGVVYIIIGIGLQGQSRFTLYLAVVVPTAAAGLVLNSAPAGPLDMLLIARLAIDLVVVLCCAMLLINTSE